MREAWSRPRRRRPSQTRADARGATEAPHGRDLIPIGSIARGQTTAVVVVIGAFELELLRLRLSMELTRGQARIARALIAGPRELADLERPTSYAEIAASFGITKSTVAAQMRRVARRHPVLWEAIAAERARRIGAWRIHAVLARRERSRRWGKRR